MRGGGPFEGWSALGPKKRGNRHDYMIVAIDETAIEVCKSKKNLDIGDRAGNWPIGDGGYASGVHRNTFWRNNES